MHKLLLIDDDLALGDLLSDYLSAHQFEVDTASSPDRGLSMLRSSHYDLLLLDVMMPIMDGFQVLTKVRQFSSIPVIMLTAKGDDYDKILGLELGADDYLSKPFNHRELLARIKALIRRLHTQSQSLKTQKYVLNKIELDEASHTVVANQEILVLTSTEFQILGELMKKAEHVVSKEELSERVLGRKLAPFDRSLDMHVSNVRKKLTQTGVAEVIKTVRGRGYLMMAESSGQQ